MLKIISKALNFSIIKTKASDQSVYRRQVPSNLIILDSQ